MTVLLSEQVDDPTLGPPTDSRSRSVGAPRAGGTPVRAERDLTPAVVSRTQATLAPGTVEHRPLARRVADHRDADRRAAASARPTTAGVHVVRLVEAVAPGARLDSVAPAVV